MPAAPSSSLRVPSTVCLPSRCRRFASGSAADIRRRHRSRTRRCSIGLLEDAGFELEWNPTFKGVGAYESRHRDPLSVSSSSASAVRHSTAINPDAAVEITPEIADARQFEERLRHGIKEGSFYTLLVNPKYYQRAYQELSRRFPIELVDFEELFLRALRQVVDKAGAKWDAVVSADAIPGDGKWDKLMVLVKRAIPIVEEQIGSAKKPMLVIYAGLLARYGQMVLLERLRDRIGRRDGIPGLWLLVPGDHHALMDGKAIPLIGRGQQVRIPESWIGNRHRAGGGDEEQVGNNFPEDQCRDHARECVVRTGRSPPTSGVSPIHREDRTHVRGWRACGPSEPRSHDPWSPGEFQSGSYSRPVP